METGGEVGGVQGFFGVVGGVLCAKVVIWFILNKQERTTNTPKPSTPQKKIKKAKGPKKRKKIKMPHIQKTKTPQPPK